MAFLLSITFFEPVIKTKYIEKFDGNYSVNTSEYYSIFLVSNAGTDLTVNVHQKDNYGIYYDHRFSRPHNYSDLLKYFGTSTGTFTYESHNASNFISVMANIPSQCQNNTYVYTGISDKSFDSTDDANIAMRVKDSYFCMLLVPPVRTEMIFSNNHYSSNDEARVYFSSGGKVLHQTFTGSNTNSRSLYGALLIYYCDSQFDSYRQISIRYYYHPEQYDKFGKYEIEKWVNLKNYEVVPSTGLSSGQIAGIVIGCILGFLAIVFFFRYFCCRGVAVSESNTEYSNVHDEII